MQKLLLLFLAFLFMGCEVHTDHDEKTNIQFQTKTIQIGNQSFEVEIAQTQSQRQRGLMFREELKPNTGMFFVFETENIYPFWMKNTLIPLDIIWFDKNGIIVDIQSMEPCTETICKSYIPKKKSQYVLEVNRNEFAGKTGDNIKKF